MVYGLWVLGSGSGGDDQGVAVEDELVRERDHAPSEGGQQLEPSQDRDLCLGLGFRFSRVA